jgi:hypothetical protein
MMPDTWLGPRPPRPHRALGRRCQPAARPPAHSVPGAVGLFAEIDSLISLAFLTRFRSQDKAGWLTPARLRRWLSAAGYSGRTDPAVLHQLAAAILRHQHARNRRGCHHRLDAEQPGALGRTRCRCQ